MSTIEPVGMRGKYLTWLAKVGTGPSDIVIIKRARQFSVGQRIEFKRTEELRGMSVGMAPRNWRTGIIEQINEVTGMLYIKNL